MLPLISFETGRKTQTQSSGQPDELRQQMEVWFYPRIETAAERPTPRAEKGKGFLHRRSSRAHQEAFCLLTRPYDRSGLVLRGGYGIYYSRPTGQTSTLSVLGTPFALTRINTGLTNASATFQ